MHFRYNFYKLHKWVYLVTRNGLSKIAPQLSSIITNSRSLFILTVVKEDYKNGRQGLNNSFLFCF